MKDKWTITAFVSLFLAACLSFSALFRYFDKNLTAVTADTSPTHTIVIDAGHGGEDCGAVGITGVLEKDLNLTIARRLAALLRGAGYHVIETRTDDRLLYAPEDANGHKKRGDLKNRLAYMDAYPDCIFISIHMNTYPLESCKGLQVWYAPSVANSKEIAGVIQEEVKLRLQQENHRAVKPANSMIYLLHHAKAPAVLVECGFLTSPEECKKLSEAEYQQALAVTIFSALVNNLKN